MKHFLFAPLLLALATAPVWAQNQNQPTRPTANTGAPANSVNGIISQAERTQNADALLLAYGQAATVIDHRIDWRRRAWSVTSQFHCIGHRKAAELQGMRGLAAHIGVGVVR